MQGVEGKEKNWGKFGLLCTSFRRSPVLATQLLNPWPDLTSPTQTNHVRGTCGILFSVMGRAMPREPQGLGLTSGPVSIPNWSWTSPLTSLGCVFLPVKWGRQTKQNKTYEVRAGPGKCQHSFLLCIFPPKPCINTTSL